MNIKNIFSYMGLILVMGLTLSACTQDEQNLSGDKPYKTENGFYVFPVDFQCSISDYDEGGKTRSMSYEWNNMTTLFARFKSGSTYYYGFMTYENSRWQLVATTDFLELTTSGTIELYYVRESNGDNYYYNLKSASFDIYNKGSLVKNTSLPWNNKSFDLSEGTAVYYTESGTYSFSASDGIYTVKASLLPAMWRMRFSGTDGTTVTMPAADNDILYLTSFNWYEAEDYMFYVDFKDINLKVSNNYTPYIYGIFNSNLSNKITLKNGNDTYTRNFDASNLPAGKSGCFTLPTSSNYNSAGWTKVANEVPMTLKDMMAKPIGVVNINLYTASYQAIRDEVAKAYKITEGTYSDNLPEFTLSVDDNPSCSNMTYHELPFYSFEVRDGSSPGVGISYTFRIEKSKASYNYESYLNKIIQDFKDQNILLEGSSTFYGGLDANYNYDFVMVSEDDTVYEFYISIGHWDDGVSMNLKDMMEKPFGTIDLDFSTATYSKIKTILSSMYTFEENTESNGTGLHYFYIHKTDYPSIEQFSFLGKPLGSLCIRERDRGFYVEYNFYINKSDMPNPYSYMDQITQEFNNINIPMTYELDPYDDSPECLALGYYNIGDYTAGGRSYWVSLYSRNTYHFEIGTSYYTK